MIAGSVQKAAEIDRFCTETAIMALGGRLGVGRVEQMEADHDGDRDALGGRISGSSTAGRTALTSSDVRSRPRRAP